MEGTVTSKIALQSGEALFQLGLPPLPVAVGGGGGMRNLVFDT